MDQLKPFVPDTVSGRPLVMFEYRGGFRPEGVPTGQGWVEAVRDHRFNDKQEIEFLVHWRGTPASEDVWELGENLWDDASPVLFEYCSHNLLEFPADEPTSPQGGVS